jgi:hypothetical protein
VRLLVDPTDTKVYVDGNYAGTVEDFNGMSSRLILAEGRHEVTLKLDGFTTKRFEVFVTPGEILKIRYDMVKGSGEDPNKEVVGQPRQAYRDEDDRSSRDDRFSRDDRSSRDERSLRSSRMGTLRLEVHPDDASVYVDGEFKGSGAQTLELPVGRHRVEVVRPGYRTESEDVNIREEEPADLGLSLERLL